MKKMGDVKNAINQFKKGEIKIFTFENRSLDE